MLRFKRILMILLLGIVIWRSFVYCNRDNWISLRIPGDGNGITLLTFSPDGSTLAFASRRVPKVHVLDLRTNKLKFKLDCSNIPMELKYLASGNLVVYGSALGSDGYYAIIWNPNGQVVQRIRSEMEFKTIVPDFNCECNFDFRLAKSGTLFDEICEYAIIDKKTGKKVDSIRFDGLVATKGIESLDCCLKLIAKKSIRANETDNESGKAFFLNLRTGTIKLLSKIDSYYGATAIFSHNLAFFALFENDTKYGRGVEVWDINNDRKIGEISYYSKDFAPSVRFSMDENQFAVAGGDTKFRMFIPVSDIIGGPYGEVSLWEIPTLRLINRYQTNRVVTAIEFFPDGKRIAVGFNDGTIEILNESFTKKHAGDRNGVIQR